MTPDVEPSSGTAAVEPLEAPGEDAPGHPARELYLQLLKQVLTRACFDQTFGVVRDRPGARHLPRRAFQALLASRGLELVTKTDPSLRHDGRDLPRDAETMIGMVRLDNLQYCCSHVVEHGVPGDFIETGVWRGGATIFMRAVLKAYGVNDRLVWVADSFQGLPRPSPGVHQDVGDQLWKYDELAVGLDEVKANFARYGLLDPQVRFLPGWFSDTLPHAPIERLAVMRLDGDMYQSTSVALEALYPKLSPGGYVIVDDYGAVPACRSAVDDYRSAHGIDVPLKRVDWAAAYWQRPR